MGTNGAGKSFLTRSILDDAKQTECWFEWMVDGRKRPLATEVRYRRGGVLFVPGHYHTSCGGCDTLKTVEQTFDLVKLGARNGYHVLFEGILAQDSFPRILDLNRDHDLTVIGLTT